MASKTTTQETFLNASLIDGKERVRIAKKSIDPDDNQLKWMNFQTSFEGFLKWIGFNIKTSKSVTGTGATGNPIQLVNDEASPSDNTFYGKQSGVKGWFTPTSGGGGQTLSDTYANITIALAAGIDTSVYDKVYITDRNTLIGIDTSANPSHNLTALIWSALLSQNAPVASQTSGTFIIGQLWTITNYVAGDDFSNMELVSGTMNTTGAVIRATSTTPTNWSNGSDLAYDGAPYVVSTNANGDLRPFSNPLSGDIVFSYGSAGVFLGTLTGAFPHDKSSFYISPFEGGVKKEIYWNSIDDFAIESTGQDDQLFYTQVTVTVNI